MGIAWRGHMTSGDRGGASLGIGIASLKSSASSLELKSLR
jgi:hypothetical protein